MAVSSDFNILAVSPVGAMEFSRKGILQKTQGNSTTSITWAVDLKKENPLKNAYDRSAIEESIDNIILTDRTERVFEPEFGCDLTRYIFENFNRNVGDSIVFDGQQIVSSRSLNADLDTLLDQLIKTILRYETRIEIDANRSSITLFEEYNALKIEILYRIIQTGLETTYTTYVET